LDDGQYVFDSLSFGTPKTFLSSNAVFEITFSCKTYGGKTVTGYYKGSLKSYISQPGKKKAQKTNYKKNTLKF